MTQLENAVTLREIAYFRHSPINHEVGPIHETTLIAGQEQDGLSLFNGFAEAAGWEVHLAALAFGCVVTEPVLQQSRTKDRTKQL